MFTGGFYDGIHSFHHVFGGHVYLDVGGDAKLQVIHVGVVHGRGGEADAPSVGKFGGEGESGTSTRLVADDDGLRHFLHLAHEIVGGTEGTSVGENCHGLLPTDTVGGWLYINRLGRGEVAVSGAFLVADVACQDLFVGEAGGKPFGEGEQSSAIVADVENQPVADGKFVQYFVQVAFSDGGTEATIKVIQEVISIFVFTIFTMFLFKGETLHWNHVAAFCCLIAAVYFVFMD